MRTFLTTLISITLLTAGALAEIPPRPVRYPRPIPPHRPAPPPPTRPIYPPVDNPPVYTPPSSYNACSTFSRGITFYSNWGDQNSNSTAVVSSCQQNPYTNNNECVRNLQCGGIYNPYPSGQALCMTSSHNLTFQAVMADPSQASQSAVGQCQQNPYTNNNECTANLQCLDAATNNPGPNVTTAHCQTQSLGLVFDAFGDDVNSQSNYAVGRCQQVPFTNNNECTRNLACENPYYGRIPQIVISCNTYSAGINFNLGGSDMGTVSSQVVSQCQQNPYTNNNECVNDLVCQVNYW